MLDIGWPELFLIGAVALIVVGPRDLPRAMRTVSQYVRRARALARDFQRGVEDMARETELEDVRAELASASGISDARDLRREIEAESGIDEIRNIGRDFGRDAGVDYGDGDSPAGTPSILPPGAASRPAATAETGETPPAEDPAAKPGDGPAPPEAGRSGA